MPKLKYLYTCSFNGIEYWNIYGKIIAINKN